MYWELGALSSSPIRPCRWLPLLHSLNCTAWLPLWQALHLMVPCPLGTCDDCRSVTPHTYLLPLLLPAARAQVQVQACRVMFKQHVGFCGSFWCGYWLQCSQAARCTRGVVSGAAAASNSGLGQLGVGLSQGRARRLPIAAAFMQCSRGCAQAEQLCNGSVVPVLAGCPAQSLCSSGAFRLCTACRGWRWSPSSALHPSALSCTVRCPERTLVLLLRIIRWQHWGRSGLVTVPFGPA